MEKGGANSWFQFISHHRLSAFQSHYASAH